MSDKTLTKKIINTARSDVIDRLEGLTGVIDDAETFDLDVLALTAKTIRRLDDARNALEASMMRRVDGLRHAGVGLEQLAAATGMHKNTLRRHWAAVATGPAPRAPRPHHAEAHAQLLTALEAWKELEASEAAEEGREPRMMPLTEEAIILDGETIPVGRRLHVQKVSARKAKIDPELKAAIDEVLGTTEWWRKRS